MVNTRKISLASTRRVSLLSNRRISFQPIDEKNYKMQPHLATFLSKTHFNIVLGASLFSTGILMIILKTWIIEVITASLLVLKPNSLLESAWRKTPIEIPTNVYFFNWTNPDDFRNFSIKPKFQELGPYRFNQDMEKVNVVWNENNTVTFNQLRSWNFDKRPPNGNVSDTVTTLNAITMAGSHYVRNWNYMLKKAVSVLLATVAPSVHITRTVNQLLFEGYDDLIVDIANLLPFIASEIPRFDRFGWFRVRNGSADFDGVFNMATGVGGHFDVMKWNYFSETPYFNGSCNKVRGSAGELYPSKLRKDHIGIFVSDICRNLLLDFEEEVEVNGVLGYKYSFGDSIFDNGTKIPGNECYCAGECIPSGMINVSSCRWGLPTFVSLPNFYLADPVYLDALEGLRPEKSKHESYIILEPTTGVPLNASLKIQLNLLIHPIEDISVFENVPELFFPLLWAEQTAELPSSLFILLKLYLNLSLIICVTGVVFITAGLYLLLFVVYKPALVSMFKNFYVKQPPRPLRPEEVPLHHDEEKGYINIALKDLHT